MQPSIHVADKVVLTQTEGRFCFKHENDSMAFQCLSSPSPPPPGSYTCELCPTGTYASPAADNCTKCAAEPGLGRATPSSLPIHPAPPPQLTLSDPAGDSTSPSPGSPRTPRACGARPARTARCPAPRRAWRAPRGGTRAVPAPAVCGGHTGGPNALA